MIGESAGHDSVDSGRFSSQFPGAHTAVCHSRYKYLRLQSVAASVINFRRMSCRPSHANDERGVIVQGAA